MSENILDLRQERCPLALLLAKRFVQQLSNNVEAYIYVQDLNSVADIIRYLVAQSIPYSTQQIDSEIVISLRKEN